MDIVQYGGIPDVIYEKVDYNHRTLFVTTN